MSCLKPLSRRHLKTVRPATRGVALAEPEREVVAEAD
jgi:hypothetical protein